MTGNVLDRWHTKNKETGRKVKGPRYGRGKRWQAGWPDASAPSGERTMAFDTEDAAKAHLAKIAAGVPTTAATGPTFADCLALWRGQHTAARENTRRLVGNYVRNLPEDFMARPIDEITREELQELVNGWAENVAPGSVRLRWQYTKSVFYLAIEDKKTANTPFSKVVLPPLDGEEIVPLTRPQLAAITAGMPPWLHTMVILGAATGLRIGELRGLTWDHVTDTEVHVKRQLKQKPAEGFGPPKSKSSIRRVAMGKVAHEALVAHRKAYPAPDSGFIWHNEGRPLSGRNATHLWVIATAKIEGLRARSGWHDLRHYNASLLINAGLSVVAVANRLGHSNPVITLTTYAHLWPTDQSAATSAIDAALTPPEDEGGALVAA